MSERAQSSLIDPDNGEWTLVRRVSPNYYGMHPADDFLAGTAVYGKYSGPTDDNTFSVAVSLL